MADPLLVELMDRTSLVSEVQEPTLPTCCPIPNESLQPGSIITIYGNCPSKEGRFRVDLYASHCQHVRIDGKSVYDPAERIVALHFNARFGEGPCGSSYVLMNSYHNGNWDEDQRSNEFPFEPEQPFCLMFLIEPEQFKIFVDGSSKPHYEFKHRFHVGDITRVHIEGPNLVVDSVEFRKPLPEGAQSQTKPEQAPPMKETATTEDESANRESRAVPEQIVTAPTVPYFEYNPNLSKPCDIHITGTLLEPITQYFVINLAQTKNQKELKKTNIPVHISIRPTQAKIVRNSLIQGNWGDEEINSEIPLELSAGDFQILLNNRNDQVLIWINGKQYCQYKHRHDPTMIDTLEINGNAKLTSIRYVFQ